MIIGRRIDDLRSTLDGQALIKVAESSGWRPLRPQETIFANAKAFGWTRGIAGWSNPYCRLFALVLDSCFWLPDQFTPAHMYSHMSPERTMLQNALAPVDSSIRRLRGEVPQGLSATESHVRDVRQLLEPAKALIADEQIGFVFVHLAVPHPPGVYDRHTRQIENGGSYLDNLALADSDLGELLEVVQSTRSAADTAVIVCSDHSWRIPMWRHSAWWTAEDEEAAKKGFDARPVLLVHFPRQGRVTTISRQINSIGGARSIETNATRSYRRRATA